MKKKLVQSLLLFKPMGRILNGSGRGDVPRTKRPSWLCHCVSVSVAGPSSLFSSKTLMTSKIVINVVHSVFFIPLYNLIPPIWHFVCGTNNQSKDANMLTTWTFSFELKKARCEGLAHLKVGVFYKLHTSNHLTINLVNIII